jgi:hypothetical protein
VDDAPQMVEDRPGEIRLAGDIIVDARIAGHGLVIDSFRRGIDPERRRFRPA